MAEVCEAALLQRTVDGDRHAWQLLIEACLPKVLEAARTLDGPDTELLCELICLRLAQRVAQLPLLDDLDQWVAEATAAEVRRFGRMSEWLAERADAEEQSSDELPPHSPVIDPEVASQCPA